MAFNSKKQAAIFAVLMTGATLGGSFALAAPSMDRDTFIYFLENYSAPNMLNTKALTENIRIAERDWTKVWNEKDNALTFQSTQKLEVTSKSESVSSTVPVQTARIEKDAKGNVTRMTGEKNSDSRKPFSKWIAERDGDDGFTAVSFCRNDLCALATFHVCEAIKKIPNDQIKKMMSDALAKLYSDDDKAIAARHLTQMTQGADGAPNDLGKQKAGFLGIGLGNRHEEQSFLDLVVICQNYIFTPTSSTPPAAPVVVPPAAPKAPTTGTSAP